MDDACYYADGSVFRGKPEDAPTENVVCIAIPPRKVRPTDPPGTFYRWTLLHEWDMYIYLDPPKGSWRVRGWHGINKYEDLKRHLKLANLAKGEVRAVLDGVHMDWSMYQEIVLKAERDHGMTRR